MKRIASAALLSLAAFGAQAADNLFENPSFELPYHGGNSILGGGSTAVTGWTTVLSGVEHFNESGYGLAADGDMLVDLANYVCSGGGIEQTVTTTPGQEYEVTFNAGNFLGFGRTGTGIVKVTIDGNTQEFTTAQATTGTLTWELRSFSFVAAGTETTVRFWNDQNANQYFAFIDGVGMTPAVPEPSTWVLLAGGLGLLGWGTRRRA